MGLDVEIRLEPGRAAPKVLILTGEMNETVAELARRLSAGESRFLAGRRGEEVLLLDPAQVRRIYAQGQQVLARTDGETVLLKNRLYELEEQLARLELPRDFEQAFSLYMTAYGKRENAYFSVESGACREKVWNPPTVEEFLTAPDEGGYAAVALRFIRAITDGENCRMVLSVPNNGAIDGLRDDDVVEITCDIRSDGAHPVRIGAIDEFQLQQIKRLKYFERCTIQAILEDDRDAAVKGLALHPLVNDFELAETLTDIFFDKYAEFIHMNETP